MTRATEAAAPLTTFRRTPSNRIRLAKALERGRDLAAAVWPEQLQEAASKAPLPPEPDMICVTFFTRTVSHRLHQTIQNSTYAPVSTVLYNQLSTCLHRCLIPRFYCAILSKERKEALWDGRHGSATTMHTVRAARPNSNGNSHQICRSIAINGIKDPYIREHVRALDQGKRRTTDHTFNGTSTFQLEVALA